MHHPGPDVAAGPIRPEQMVGARWLADRGDVCEKRLARDEVRGGRGSRINDRMTVPRTASRCRRNRRNAARVSDSCLTATTWGAATIAASPAKTDPRVSPCVEEVDEDVGHQDGRPDDQDDAHHECRVTVASGANRKLAHPGPGEDLLGDHRARDELGQQQADDGDDRDERVAERVPMTTRSGGEALGLGRRRRNHR